MEKINNELKEHIELVGRILDTQTENIQEITNLIIDCYKKGGKVILFGNGGSAADAQHIAAELVGKYKLERKSLPAIALTTNISILTAVGNDYGFEKIFERQIEDLVTERDIVIGISTSGNTVNVIKGILKAKEAGAKTVAFTGSSGGKLKDEVDILLNIPSDNTPRIQEAHILAGHIICGLVEENISEVQIKNMETEIKKVKIGNRLVGEGEPAFIVAEIGINHNGNINIAKKLIDMAVFAGCDAVKFQKRTIELVYTPEELAKERENPFGPTNGDLKRGLEFGEKEYQEIDRYCKERGIIWFASPWDVRSVDFLEKFNVPCYKIASACLTDDELLKYVKSKGKPIILSTGMSTKEEIKHAVEIIGKDNLILLHCTSTYPSKIEELNLKVIPWLKEKFNCPIGYSGHETGVVEPIMATVLGACAIEKHITLDRAMWGSDQAASLEPNGLNRLVRDIRNESACLGDGDKKIFESEIPILQKLRKNIKQA